MSRFLLDTDKVSSTMDSLSSVYSTIDSISSSVASYPISSDPEFDFSKAQKALQSSIEACAMKVKNTQAALNEVVQAHMNLQNSLLFVSSGKKTSNDTVETGAGAGGNSQPSSVQEPSAPASPSSSGNTGGGYVAPYNARYSGNSSSGGGSYREYSVSYKKPKPYKAFRKASPDEAKKVAQAVSTVAAPAAIATEKIKKVQEKNYIKQNLTTVSYAAPKESLLSEESKRIYKYVSYDDNNYAKVDDRYLISCDSSVGKVGDVIKFTSEAGDTSEYVVGINTLTHDNKDKLYFLVNETESAIEPLDSIDYLTRSTTKIENLGNYKSL